MNGLNLLIETAWRGTIVLIAGMAAAYLLGRASAAVRHYLWTTVFCALLALPAAMLIGPKWAVLNQPVLAPAPVPHTTSIAAVRTQAPAAPAQKPTSNPISWLYAAGVAAVAIRFVAGAIRTRRLLAGAVPATRLGIPRKLRVMETANVPVPLVWGIVRPVIVLPTASRHWSAARLRTVLMHELIHVQRHDLLAQVVAQIACCIYWFNPLAWIAAREMRKERERACDDAVLQRGIAAPEYAGHLVDLVRSMTIAVPAMAEASGFEERVRALLDRTRNRAPLTRRVAFAVAAMACTLILPTASITSFAQGSRGALAGVVIDPSGSRIPGAAVFAKNMDGGNEEKTKANEAGEFIFRAIPPGRYELEFRVPGFKPGKKEAVVTAGTLARGDAALALGDISESVTVSGRGQATAAPRSATPVGQSPQRSLIGGNVQASRLVRQPRAEYPADLQQQGITGTVMLKAIIGKDGWLLNPQVVNTEIHPGLAQAALEAVRKWQYQPTLLNGMPVETLTSIDIHFELGQ